MLSSCNAVGMVSVVDVLESCVGSSSNFAAPMPMSIALSVLDNCSVVSVPIIEWDRKFEWLLDLVVNLPLDAATHSSYVPIHWMVPWFINTHVQSCTYWCWCVANMTHFPRCTFNWSNAWSYNCRPTLVSTADNGSSTTNISARR